MFWLLATIFSIFLFQGALPTMNKNIFSNLRNDPENVKHRGISWNSYMSEGGGKFLTRHVPIL